MKNLIISALRDLLSDCREYVLNMDSAYGTDEAAALVSRINNAIKMLEKL